MERTLRKDVNFQTGQTSLEIQTYRTCVWEDPGRDGWKIFEGGTAGTLPMLCCEDDNDDDEI